RLKQPLRARRHFLPTGPPEISPCRENDLGSIHRPCSRYGVAPKDHSPAVRDSAARRLLPRSAAAPIMLGRMTRRTAKNRFSRWLRSQVPTREQLEENPYVRP